MTVPIDPTKHTIQINKAIIAGEVLFEGSVAEFPEVRVFGILEIAVRADVLDAIQMLLAPAKTPSAPTYALPTLRRHLIVRLKRQIPQSISADIDYTDLRNSGKFEATKELAHHESASTTRLYDRCQNQVLLNKKHI